MRELSYNRYIYRLAVFATICAVIIVVFSSELVSGRNITASIRESSESHSTIRRNGETIVGTHNTIYGDDNFITGNHNTIHGNNNTITGNHNTVHGEDNIITGNHNRFRYDAGNSATGNHNREIR